MAFGMALVFMIHQEKTETLKMNSLLYSAASTISATSSRRRAENKRPDREDRFVLEHFGKHKSFYTDTILNGSVFQKDRTSFTRTCNNVVSRSQYLLQMMQNMSDLQQQLRTQLVIAGRALHGQGLMYDDDFPVTLRNWILSNALGTKVLDPTDPDPDLMRSTIGQLILLLSIRDELY